MNLFSHSQQLTSFAIGFCLIVFFRWVENSKSAARLIEIWDNIGKLLTFWKSLPKSKRPKCKSYETLKVAFDDHLMIPKLQFFNYVANIVEPFLRKYQTDQPMVPFLFFDLKDTVTKLFEIIIKPEVLEKCKTWSKMKQIDFSESDNLLPDGKINVGFAVTEQLKQLRKKDLVKSSEIKEFFKMARQFVVSMIEKLSEKSPLNSLFVRGTTIFDPKLLLEYSKQKLIDRLKILLGEFMSLNILTSLQCDTVLSQFNNFVENEVKELKTDSFKFDPKNDRLDDFYFQHACVNNYKDLSFVLRVVLTLSHGQASVERGFSFNNFSVKTNMTPATIISRRTIKDHLIANGLKPHTVEITSSIIKAFRSARQKYMDELEEAKKQKEKTDAELKAVSITTDIEKLRQKVKTAEKAVALMEEEVTKYMELAEKKSDLSFVKTSNGLKRKSNETKQEIQMLNDQIAELEKKRKTLISA